LSLRDPGCKQPRPPGKSRKLASNDWSQWHS
jgi:hypothetical protein